MLFERKDPACTKKRFELIDFGTIYLFLNLVNKICLKIIHRIGGKGNWGINQIFCARLKNQHGCLKTY